MKTRDFDSRLRVARAVDDYYTLLRGGRVTPADRAAAVDLVTENLYADEVDDVRRTIEARETTAEAKIR